MFRLNVDYRHFDSLNITPRFEFGFGLSYTNFTYSGLHITKVEGSTDKELEESWAAGNATPIAQGSSTALWYVRFSSSERYLIGTTGSTALCSMLHSSWKTPAQSGEATCVSSRREI